MNQLVEESPDTIEYENGQKRYPTLEKIYKKYFSQIKVFKEAE